MTSHERLFLNGDMMPLSEGCISVEDRGFQFADGVYEVIRVAGGRPFRLHQHLERLERSAAGLELTLSYDGAAMERVCEELIAQSEMTDASIYIQVTRGVAPRNHLPSEKSVFPTTVAYIRAFPPIPPDVWERGVTAVSRPDDRWAHCDLKTVGLVASVLGKLDAKRRGADEVIYTGADGTVYEGGSVNVFAVSGGEALTHPAGPKILNGVTRMALLELCPAEGIPCHERPASLERYLEADEVFLSSTMRGVMPILSIDGRAIGDGRPGPITRRIHEAFRRLMDVETACSVKP